MHNNGLNQQVKEKMVIMVWLLSASTVILLNFHIWCIKNCTWKMWQKIFHSFIICTALKVQPVTIFSYASHTLIFIHWDHMILIQFFWTGTVFAYIASCIARQCFMMSTVMNVRVHVRQLRWCYWPVSSCISRTTVIHNSLWLVFLKSWWILLLLLSLYYWRL